MSLTPGTRLGPYEVLAKLGEGGMGEVYRARDAKLNRDVALKILPAAFIDDGDRLARFRREAQVLASLNHPNIAAIYGFEDSGATHALVMELVDGSDLSALIAAAPGTPEAPRGLSIDDALPLAKQIATALEAAHELGIVHRDLKPANIKVRADGTVKVLDFGLAKAMDPSGSNADAMNSRTLTSPAMTQAGMILGTAAYMAPEQARGRAVDKRADVWAFGVVVFEMLTGRRAFPGDDITDTIVSVVSKEPDWAGLPAATPAGLRRLLARCLKKDPKARLRDIGEARAQIEELLAGTADIPAGAIDSLASSASLPASSPRNIPWLPWTVAAVSVIALVGVAVWSRIGRTEPAAPLLRLTIPASAGDQVPYAPHNRGSFALSPDGSVLVFRGGMVEGNSMLYQRRLDQAEASPLAGTEIPYGPFFSPEGEWIAFAGFGGLRKVSLRGGPSFTICPLPGGLHGGSWGEDGFIYFAGGGPIQRVSAAGGAPEPVTQLRPGDRSHRWPHLLPGGNALLYTAWIGPGLESAVVVAESLATHEREVIARGGTDGRYVSSGHVVYALPEGLMSVPFDARTLKTTGSPRPIGERVFMGTATGHARFAVSAGGILVYEPGADASADAELVWVDRKGVPKPVRPERARYLSARLSPVNKSIALAITDANGGEQIFVLDPDRGTFAKRTFEGTSLWPVWTPDGTRLTYMGTRSDGTSNIYWRKADGSGVEERLTTDKDRVQYSSSWSGDGKVLTIEETGGGLSYLSMDGGKAVRREILESSWNKDTPRISWDGKWLAYASTENGPLEIFVQSFPTLDDKHLISSGGGTSPRWSRDGRELFYWAPPGKIMAVSVTPGSSFISSKPTMLFEGTYISDYDVSADGKQFLMIKTAGQGRAASHFNVVVNWLQELTGKK